MNKNPTPLVIVFIYILILIPKIRGKSNATSMSKTRNTTASRKNRIEKGSRPDSLGSNPHSKGVILLRLEVLRSPSRLIRRRRKVLNITIKEKYSPNDSIVMWVSLG